MELLKLSTILTIVTFLLGISHTGITKRILAAEFLGSKSHVLTYLGFLEELASRGHDVTLLSPLKNFTKSIREIYSTNFDSSIITKILNLSLYDMKEQDVELNPFTALTELTPTLCRKVYEDPEAKQLLEEPFDLVIIQPLFNECSLGFIHRIMTKNKAPLILFLPMSAPVFLVSPLGGHHPPSFVSNFGTAYGDEMTFKERLHNFFLEVSILFVYNWIYVPAMEQIYRQEMGDPSLPSVKAILSETSLVFSNTHFSITRPKPNLPNVIDVGGIHSHKAKPLPKELDLFISKGGTDGFILFSFGTGLRGDMMADAKRQIFVNVFAKLKQQVIWKYESDHIPSLSSNVKLSKWVPQQDLLGDPRIKMFITHCGMGSMEESIYHGVPLLGIPFYGDQPLNAQQAARQGFLRLLDWNELTEEKLLESINDVISNQKYREKVQQLSNDFKDQIDSPLERAIWWTEYVIRHKGAPTLQSGARKLNFFQYHSLDIIALILGVLSLIIYIVVKGIRIILAFVFGRNVKRDIKKSQ